RPIRKGRKHCHAQANAYPSVSWMHRLWHDHLHLEGHKPMLPSARYGDVFDAAVYRATPPKAHPPNFRQINMVAVYLEPLRIAERIREKFLAVCRWLGATCVEIGVGTV